MQWVNCPLLVQKETRCMIIILDKYELQVSQVQVHVVAYSTMYRYGKINFAFCSFKDNSVTKVQIIRGIKCKVIYNPKTNLTS